MIEGDFTLVSEISVDNLNSTQLNKLVPYFSTESSKNRIPLELLVKRYSNGVSSMLLENQDDLFKHLLNLQKISLAHYKLGKSHKMKSNFPYECCGLTSHNINIALLENGYGNSMSSYCSKFDHAYNILPFVIKDSDKKGVILLDGTSEQLWDNLEESKKPKSLISVFFSNEWEYITNWRSSANLYPNMLSTIETIETELERSGHYEIWLGNTERLKSIKGEIKKSWKNPITIDLESKKPQNYSNINFRKKLLSKLSTFYKTRF